MNIFGFEMSAVGRSLRSRGTGRPLDQRFGLPEHRLKQSGARPMRILQAVAQTIQSRLRLVHFLELMICHRQERQVPRRPTAMDSLRDVLSVRLLENLNRL